MNGRILIALVIGCAATAVAQETPTLPTPTGAWNVGTRILPPVVDSSRPDSAFASGFRTLNVQIWYPVRAINGERSLYLDEATLEAIKSSSGAPDIIESWRPLRTHAIVDAPIPTAPFPLVLFSPGFGVPRASYSTWTSELASYGFVVAAVDHPYAGLAVIEGRVFRQTPNPNGPTGQTAAMAADLRLLASLLPSGLALRDSLHVAAVGHSMGGAAALEACRLDQRITACVNMDGYPFGAFADTGVGKPYLVIHQQPVFPDAKPDGELARLGREIDSTWKAIIARQTAPVTRLQVHGTGHFSFSDAPYVRPSLVTEDGGCLSDPTLVMRSTTAVIVEYIRNVFSGKPERPLALPDLVVPARMGVPATR